MALTLYPEPCQKSKTERFSDTLVNGKKPLISFAKPRALNTPLQPVRKSVSTSIDKNLFKEMFPVDGKIVFLRELVKSERIWFPLPIKSVYNSRKKVAFSNLVSSYKK